MPNTGSLPNWIHGADPAAFFLPGFQAAAALAQARTRMQQEAQEFDVQSQMRQQALTEEAERRKQEMAIAAQQHAIETQLAVRRMQETENQHRAMAKMAWDKWQQGAPDREAMRQWRLAQAAKAAQPPSTSNISVGGRLVNRNTGNVIYDPTLGGSAKVLEAKQKLDTALAGELAKADPNEDKVSELRAKIEATQMAAAKLNPGYPMEGYPKPGATNAPPEQRVPLASILNKTPGAQPEQRVKVKSPDGKAGSIPASQLDAAVKAGYTDLSTPPPKDEEKEPEPEPDAPPEDARD